MEFKHITTEVGEMKVKALSSASWKSTFALAGSSLTRAVPPVTCDGDGTKRRYCALRFAESLESSGPAPCRIDF